MTSRICFVIPDHNHAAHIGGVIDALSAHAAPIYLVDDGSDDPTARVLADLAARQPLVRLHRLENNQGKGGAVMHGMRLAHADGFTHALQIDADGQHDLADVPRFLAACQEAPDAVICGVPIYDASVPRSRLYGRRITDFWVRIETLSGRIEDAMCGFRVYPLAPCIALFDRRRIGPRMEFDIEILVRLAWQGVGIRNLRTRVIYPPAGSSNFRMLRDNLRISWLHTRLFFGMLRHLPRLLRRDATDTRHWSERAERGSILGIRFLLWVYRVLGRGICKAIMAPVIAYFFLTGRSARRASSDYLRRVAQAAAAQGLPTVRPGLLQGYRHFMNFGDALLDKLAVWQGEFHPDELDFPNRQEYLDMIARKQGAVLLGSHLGNLDVCRAFGDVVPGLKLNVLVFTEHAERFNRVLREVNPKLANDVIAVSRIGIDTAILLKQRVEQGEYIVIVGDRTSAGARERVRIAQFLGAPAAFAEGPFVMAGLMHCPVYFIACIKQAGRYRVHFERLAEPRDLPRGERDRAMQALIDLYAKKLQTLCLLAPIMWFNFFDFWGHPGRPDEDNSINSRARPGAARENTGGSLR
jgi:predicted LPLAT superfamily acyltransferase